MSKKIFTWMLAGIFMVAVLIPLAVEARQGGKMSGQTQQIRTQSNLQIKNQLRLRDGSSLDAAQTESGSAKKKGNTYGPGDGTGNEKVGPQDGTGYGAPSNR